MRIKKMLSLLAATTIAAGAFAGFTLTSSAASLDDAKTITADLTYWFDDANGNGTTKIEGNTVFGEYFFTPYGHNAATNKGITTIDGFEHYNSLRIKSATQDRFAFKVGAAATITFYTQSHSSRGVAVTAEDYTTVKESQTAGTTEFEYSVDSAQTIYVTAFGGDFFIAGVSVDITGEASTDPTPTPIPEVATPTPIPEVATPTPNPNAGKTLDDLTPIPTSVTSLSGDDFDIAFNTYYNAVSANGYLLNGGKASSGNISSNQNVKIDGAVITGNYLDVKAGTADLTNTAKIFAFKPSADCTIKAYGRYDASKTSLRGFKLVAGENIATSEPVTDEDNSYNLATLNYSAASDGYVYIISQDSSIDAHIALIEFEWGSAPEPVETTEAGYTFKSTIEKLTTGTVTLTIVATNGQTEQEGTIDITDKLEGFSGELMLAVVINEIPEGVTITSASINLE